MKNNALLPEIAMVKNPVPTAEAIEFDSKE